MADRSPPPPMLSGSLPSSFDDNDAFYNERPMQKFTRKFKEEPLIPLGVGLTVFAFVNAWRALRRGDSQQANRMFRARVAAQGFTVIAMVGGSMYYSKDREKNKELQKLKEQRDAEEKRIKWVRELEVRDEEEKALKARLEQRRQQAQPAPSPGATPENKGTGGVIGKMGLWPPTSEAALDKSAEEPKTETEPKADTATKRPNSKSSLGDIGTIIASGKKDDGASKPASDAKPEK